MPLVLRPRDTVLLECPTSYIQNAADSDRNGDYGGVIVGEKRFFEDFVSGELDDTDQPRSLVGSLVYEIEGYRGMFRPTKEFRQVIAVFVLYIEICRLLFLFVHEFAIPYYRCVRIAVLCLSLVLSLRNTQLI